MAGRLNVTFSLQGLIREDSPSKSFVSYCPALDLYSAGRTRPDAKAALQGAIALFIRTCYDRNILGQVLHGRGFEATPTDGAPGSHEADGQFVLVQTEHGAFDDEFDVEIPLHLIAMQQQQVCA